MEGLAIGLVIYISVVDSANLPCLSTVIGCNIFNNVSRPITKIPKSSQTPLIKAFLPFHSVFTFYNFSSENSHGSECAAAAAAGHRSSQTSKREACGRVRDDDDFGRALSPGAKALTGCKFEFGKKEDSLTVKTLVLNRMYIKTFEVTVER